MGKPISEELAMYSKNTWLKILGLVLAYHLIFFTIAQGKEDESDRNGNFWMSLSPDAKFAWLDGFIAASAGAASWAQVYGISDKLIHAR